MRILEYEITLSTGERLTISEFDPDVIPELHDEEVRKACASVLKLCSYMSRAVVEGAKRGDLKPFERALKTPSYGCLLKIDTPECSEVRSCIFVKSKECTTKYQIKKLGKFPICWSYRVPSGYSQSLTISAQILATSIVNEWREGRYVIIIERSASG